MGINLKNVFVSAAVATVLTGLVCTNVNAITATATYGTAGTKFFVDGIQVSASAYSAINNPSSTTTVSTTTQAYTTLDAWLDKLAEKESGNRDRIKVLDVNGRYSYGCLQFQMATFKSYSTNYGIVDPANVTSWEELIYNCSLQKQVAKRMIQEKPGNWRHWGYTVLNKGIGLPPAKEEPATKQLAVAQ